MKRLLAIHVFVSLPKLHQLKLDVHQMMSAPHPKHAYQGVALTHAQQTILAVLLQLVLLQTTDQFVTVLLEQLVIPTKDAKFVRIENFETTLVTIFYY